MDYAAAAYEAAAKNTLVAFVQFIPVAYHVVAVVRLISHHDTNSVATHMVESATYGATESIWRGVLDRVEAGNLCLERFKYSPSCIGAPIVNYDDFMRYIVAPKFEVEMLGG